MHGLEPVGACFGGRPESLSNFFLRSQMRPSGNSSQQSQHRATISPGTKYKPKYEKTSPALDCPHQRLGVAIYSPLASRRAPRAPGRSARLLDGYSNLKPSNLGSPLPSK